MQSWAKFTVQHTLRRHSHFCVLLPSSISTRNYLLIRRRGILVYFHLDLSERSSRRSLSVSKKSYCIHNEVGLLNPRCLAKYFSVGALDKLKH